MPTRLVTFTPDERMRGFGFQAHYAGIQERHFRAVVGWCTCVDRGGGDGGDAAAAAADAAAPTSTRGRRS